MVIVESWASSNLMQNNLYEKEKKFTITKKGVRLIAIGNQNEVPKICNQS